jgi:hypothetical protein
MSTPENTLVWLWTSADAEVARRMGFMYAHASMEQKWWEHIHLIVWGPAQKELLANPDLIESLNRFIEDGGVATACRKCADEYGIASELEALGLTVEYTGSDLTRFLKSGYRVLSV